MLEDLGRLILEKRKERRLAIRPAAREVGISHSTLARVEKGFMPDLESYDKIRKWLGFVEEAAPTRKTPFRPTANTAAALARMILAAQEDWAI